MLKKIVRKIYSKYYKNKYKMKEEWLASEFLKDYKNCYSPIEILKIHNIHKKGFTLNDWNIMGLNKNNYKGYLTSAQYYAMHPINNQYSKWIDDKLTLKYLCSGTILDKYMPRYYAQIDGLGKIHKLMDYKEELKNSSEITAEDIVKVLVENKTLAIKLIDGSVGEGFYKAEFKENKYFLNGENMGKNEFIQKINSLKNYLITEYFYTNEAFSKYSATSVNCLRYLVGRIDGKLQFIKSYIRFGTKTSGFVENYNRGGILCFVDEAGHFNEGNIIYEGKNKKIKKHVDNNVELIGNIPNWKDIQKAVQEFNEYFPQLDYLGFDFVVTDKNEVKILEINSLTSLDAFQLEGSVFKTKVSEFYKRYL